MTEYIIMSMCCFSYIYRELRLFWRYRNQNNNFERYRYYLTVVSINVVMGVFYGCYSKWGIADPLNLYLFLTIALHILTLGAMIITHLNDPGKIKQIKKEIEIALEKKSIEQMPPFNGKIYFSETHSYLLGQSNKLKEIRFCNSCNIYQPDLSSHCKNCKGCIQERNHHCPWLANCIGKGNYKEYYFHLTFSVGLCILVAVLCLSGWIKHQNKSSIVSICTSIVFVITISVFLPLLSLWIIHTYSGIAGISTRVLYKKCLKVNSCSKTKDSMKGNLNNNQGQQHKGQNDSNTNSKGLKAQQISEAKINFDSTTTTSQYFNLHEDKVNRHQQELELPPQMHQSKIPFILQRVTKSVSK